MLRRFVLCAAAVWCVSAQAVTVSVNKGTTYQTIDGFGVYAAISTWSVKQGPFYVPVDLKASGWYSDIINEMGVTILRTEIPCEFQPSEGQFVVTSGMRESMRHLQNLRDEAVAAGEPFRVVASVWSPPAWMKLNNNCTQEGGNNFLDPVNFTRFGNHVVRWLRTVRDTFGLDVYAVSLQNEPAFNEPYSSCNYYNGTNYANMLAVAGPVVKAAGMNTLLFGCEHMAWAFPSWENEIKQNATAAASIDRYAFHGYSDGIQADPGSFDNISATEKPIWMSETCNYGGDYEWAGALSLAETILKFVERGKLSAWIWWKLMGESNPTYGTEWIINSADGSRSPRYYTSAQIYRFIRPDMKKVSVSCSDASLVVGAFKDDSKGSMSVVIVNTAGSSKSITLSISGGSAPAQFEALQTTNGNYLVDVGPIAGNGTFTVPAQSVTSLGYKHTGTPVHTVVPRALRAANVPAGALAASRVRVYGLNGRALGAVDIRAAQTLGAGRAAGAYVGALVDSRGRTLGGAAFVAE